MNKIIELYLKRKIKASELSIYLDNYFKNNDVLITDLMSLRNDLYQVKKEDLLDDFLLAYINNLSKVDFNSIVELLNSLNHPISRRLIINLITLNIINDTNINTIGSSYPNVLKYYDILNNKTKFDINLNNIQKYYKDVDLNTDDFFRYYVNIISCIPTLSDEEELYLFLEKDKGNKEAFDYLVVSNLRLVLSLANKMSYKLDTKEVEDLYSNGVLGLISAVSNYNVFSGIKFSTYASWSISRRIKREYFQDTIIKLPCDIAEGTNTRIEKDVNVAIDRVKQGIVSINSTLDTDSDETMVDILSDDVNIEQDNEFYKSVEDIVMLNDVIEKTNNLISSCLTEEEQKIIRSYVFDELTQKEIVAILALDMTHQNVSLKINKILKKLRNNHEFRTLINYVNDDGIIKGGINKDGLKTKKIGKRKQ
ncbi:MAG: sigma-70 family RNA polymerase sigma factor [Bacilli bacterium]|nr:sigma-70 family RNA polymerase sigma factor [Bacilli bacterium]